MFNLELYKSELNKQVQQNKLSSKTAEYYIESIRRLNEQCRGKNFIAENIANSIEKLCEGNHQIRKYIAAVKKYERDILESPKLLLYGEALAKLYPQNSICKNGKALSLSEATYLKKINRLNNERLKLAFRLEHNSGLRINEIATLKKQNIFFNECTKEIVINVCNGKGNKERTVNVVKDNYLFSRLKKHLDQIEADEMIFYSASYLKKKAGEHKIQTHDLRRVNARQRFRIERSAGNTRRDARRTVAKQLGHNDVKTTNLYLGEDW